MIPLILCAILFTQPVYEIEEVVVTATRYPVVLKEIGVTTVIIHQEELQSAVLTGLAEALTLVSGVEVRAYGSPGTVQSIALRGVPATGTLVMLNGHPLNSLTLGMADASIIDVNAIKRIEIVKGPVASLYGAYALGGVVNIITREEHAQPEFSATITPFTTLIDNPLQSTRFNVKAAAPFGDLYFSVAGGYSRSDGYRSNSDMQGYNVLSDILYAHPALNASASFTYTHKEYGVPGPLPFIDSLHGLPVLGDSTAMSLFDREKDRAALFTGQIDWHVSDHLSFTGVLFANQKKSLFHTEMPGWNDSALVEDYEYTTYTFGTHLSTVMRTGAMDLIIGLDACYDTLEAVKMSDDTGDTTWCAGSYTVGGWLEIKKDFKEIISITPMIRYDVSSDYNNCISPGIGAVIMLQSNMWLKMSAGKTFRRPSFNDLYWPIYGNPDLKPEHGWAYEMRLEFVPVPTTSGAISLFMRTIDDRIAWMPSQEGLWQPQNVNQLSVRGIEAELSHQFGPHVNSAVNATFLGATQRNHEIVYDFYDWMADTGLTMIEEVERDAAFTPPYTLTARLNIHILDSWYIHCSAEYVSEQNNYYSNYDNYPFVTMDTKTLENYVLINVAVSRTVFKHITIACAVKNVTDVKYARQFGNTIDDHDYPMPGRTWCAQCMVEY